MKKMEYTQTAVELSCPCCQRDYEVPRRYMLRKGDFDFCPLPRLLPCLHTSCHSCLQDQFERSPKGIITCTICRHSEAVKGVGYMPLDFNILKQIVSLTSSDIMAVCARCYDSIPSVSYCLSCSSALCEFHHQDHKLSVDTARHHIYTFQEALHQHKHIVYRFAPMPCPEQPQMDCSVFCQTCSELLSPQAGLLQHQTHTLAPYGDVVEEMAQLIQTAADTGHKEVQRLRREVTNVKHLISALDRQEELGTQNINKTFAVVVNQLKQRQKELTSMMSRRLQEERQRCLKILRGLQEKLDDLIFAESLARTLLVNTHTQPGRPADTPEPGVGAEAEDPHAEKMYMVAAAETIDFRLEALAQEARELLAATVKVDLSASAEASKDELAESLFRRFGLSAPRVQFLPADLATYAALSNTLGHLTEVPSPALAPPQPIEIHTRANAITSDDGEDEDESSSPLFFALHVGSENVEAAGVRDLPPPPTGGGKLRGQGQEAGRLLVVVEARALPVLPSSKANPTVTLGLPASDTTGDQTEDLQHKLRAPVWGRIVIIDDTDPAVGSQFRWKCHYDSRKERSRPVLTIRRELVASQRRG